MAEALLGWDAATKDKVLALTGLLFPVHSDTFDVLHKTVIDWLTGEVDESSSISRGSDVFAVERARGHAIFASGFLEWLNQADASGAQECARLTLPQTQATIYYYLLHGLLHLYLGGQTVAAEAMLSRCSCCSCSKCAGKMGATRKEETSVYMTPFSDAVACAPKETRQAFGTLKQVAAAFGVELHMTSGAVLADASEEKAGKVRGSLGHNAATATATTLAIKQGMSEDESWRVEVMELILAAGAAPPWPATLVALASGVAGGPAALAALLKEHFSMVDPFAVGASTWTNMNCGDTYALLEGCIVDIKDDGKRIMLKLEDGRLVDVSRTAVTKIDHHAGVGLLLSVASAMDASDVVESLLEAKASPWLTDTHLNHPLLLAAQMGSSAVGKALVTAGVPPSLCNNIS